MRKLLLILFVLIASVAYPQKPADLHPTSTGKLVGNFLWLGLSHDSLYRISLSRNKDSLFINNYVFKGGTDTTGWEIATKTWVIGNVPASQWTTEPDGIYYNGKVGIGVTNPSATDSVLQSTSASFTRGVKVGYDMTVNGLTVGKGKNGLSINTALGISALSKTTTGNFNTAIGKSAMQDNLTGQLNTALGWDALSSNTSGSYNVANGMSSLDKNTTGDKNTAIGNTAMGDNTTGNNNVAIGSIALRFNNTGFSNTAVGVSALYSNTTASNLVAIGDSALYNNTGLYNTAVGTKSLYANTNGQANTAVGRKALNKNFGSNNTGIGVNSLINNTYGADNTAIGSNSLTANTTASNNTAVGKYALNNNITGFSNVAVGITAMYENATGYRNIALGDSAGFPYTTLSNRMYLGARDSATTGIFFNRTVGVNKGYWNGKLNVKTVPYSALASLVPLAQDTLTGDVYRTTISGGASTWTLGTNKQTSTVDTAYATQLQSLNLNTSSIMFSKSLISDLGVGLEISTQNTTTGNGSSVTITNNTNPSVTWTANTQTAGNSVDLDTVSLAPSFGVPLNLGKSGTPFDTTFTNKLKVGGYNVTVTGDVSIPQAASQWTTTGSDIFYNTGKVGIGTSTPTADVHIKGSGATSASTAFKVDNSAGTNLFTVLNDGKVGIGLTIPLYPLHVTGNIRGTSNVYSNDGLGRLSFAAITGSIDGVLNIGNINIGASSTVAFNSKNIEAMRIDPSQRVGIGTTAPSSKLHVAGTSRLGNVRADSTKINGLLYLPNIDKDTLKRDGHILAWDSVNGKVMAQHDLKLGVGGDTITLSKENGLRLYGNATVWDDLMFPFATGTTAGTGYPTYDTDSLWHQFVIDTTGVSKCIIYMPVQLPHKWKEGSTIYPHIHYHHTTGEGTPTFKIKYKWVNIGETTGTWAWHTMSTTTGTTNLTQQMCYNASGISGAGKTISSILLCQIYLTGTTAATKTCGAYQIDFHIEADALGSNSETSKN